MHQQRTPTHTTNTKRVFSGRPTGRDHRHGPASGTRFASDSKVRLESKKTSVSEQYAKRWPGRR